MREFERKPFTAGGHEDKGSSGKTGGNGGGERKPYSGGGNRPSGSGGRKPHSGGGSRPSGDGERKPYSGGGERKPYSGGGERKPYSGGGNRPSGGGERKPYSGGGNRPSGDGERKPYSGGGERKPYSGSGERKPYSGGGERKPYNGGGERKPYNGGGNRPSGDGERKPYSGGGERKPYSGSGERKPYNGGGERKPYNGGGNRPSGDSERKPYSGGGERKPYSGGGERKPYNGGGNRPSGGGERKPYSGGGERTPYSGGGERKPYNGGGNRPSGEGERKPYNGGGNRPSGEGERKPYNGGGNRPSGDGERKPYSGGGERKPYSGSGERKPYSGGGERKPYSGGGNRPSGDGERKPYSGGGERKPYSGGGERKPYSGGGERKPYSGGGERKPHSGGEKRSYNGRPTSRPDAQPRSGGIDRDTPTPARRIALAALVDVSSEGAYANLALDKRLRADPRASAEDKRLATALFYGTIEKRLLLDYILTSYMDHPMEDPVTRENLRMATYQMHFMETPDYAACGQAVGLSRMMDREALCPLVNAVCRKVAAGKEQIVWPEDEMERLSIQTSTPRFLVERLITDLGKEEGEAYLRYAPTSHFTTLHHNALRITHEELKRMLKSEGFDVADGLVQDALRVKGGGVVDTTAFREGLFSIQSESSMLAVLALGLKGGMQLLDACAAPGGKSCYAAQRMGGAGRVHAMDIHPHRVKLIEAAARRLGLDNIRAREHDARETVSTFVGAMDAVLVDAPCSGLGVTGKADIQYRLTPEQIEELVPLQEAILENCAQYVKPGGVLLYATCTVLPAENDEVVDRFLQKHPQFTAKGLARHLPAPFAEKVRDEKLQLFPHRDGTEGFFICRMVRSK